MSEDARAQIESKLRVIRRRQIEAIRLAAAAKTIGLRKAHNAVAKACAKDIARLRQALDEDDSEAKA